MEEKTLTTPDSSGAFPNIVLNELDHELEQRGLHHARWADDFVILLGSERAAQRVMGGITGYLEGELGLPVNQEKSRVAPVKDVTFLGFQILGGKIRVANSARARFKKKVRFLTHRNNPLSMGEIIHALNRYLRGWIFYFRIQEFRNLLRNLDAWIRSRLRSMQLKKWKNPRKLQRIMIQTGFHPQTAHRIWVKMDKWRSVHRKEVRLVLNLEWYRRQGLLYLHDFTQATPGA